MGAMSRNALINLLQNLPEDTQIQIWNQELQEPFDISSRIQISANPNTVVLFPTPEVIKLVAPDTVIDHNPAPTDRFV